MFENIVAERIRKENSIVNDLAEINSASLDKSGLSDFTKSFLKYDVPDFQNKEDIENRIEKSNKLYFNYVIRPKWTLITFLFGNFESRPPAEIISKLDIFPFYKFYSNAIVSFIKDNFQIFITKTEASKIIDETNDVIREKLAADISNAKIKNFFIQLFNLKYGEQSEHNLESTIPYPLIKIFLEDKSYQDYRKKFEVIKNLNENYEISLKDIIKILTGKYNVAEDFKPHEEEKKPVEIILETKINETKIDETLTDKPEIGITKKEPEEQIKKEEAKSQGEEIIIKPIEKPESGKSNIYSEELIQASEEVKKINSDEDKKVIDNEITKLFNPRQLKKISAKVFASDEKDTEKSFEKIKEFKSWKETSNYLKVIFDENKVDIYNSDVYNFVNALNEYFKEREK